MNEDLYRPSLDNDSVPKKSFKLDYIYFLAFFGGVIPIIGICGKNAKWLGVKTNTIIALASLGIAFLAIKSLLLFLYYSGTLEIERTTLITFIYRACSIVLTFFYMRSMKIPYARFRLSNQPAEAMAGYVVLFLVIGIVIEAVIVVFIQTVLTGNNMQILF